MKIFPLCALVTEIELDFTRNIIRVTTQGEKKILDAMGNATPLAKPPKGSTFTKVMTSQTPCAVVRSEIDEQDGLSAATVELIEQGNPMTIPMDELSSSDPEGRQWNLILFHVLRRSSDGTHVLALLEAEEDTTLAQDERLVGVMDILGFSQMLRTLSLDELETKLQRDIFAGLATVQFLSKDFLVMRPDKELVEVPELEQLECAIISDTLIIYLKSNSHDLRTIVEAVAFLMDQTVQQGWLLRGAIDVDTFRAISEHHMFIGRALATAYQLERSQDWSGCILSDNVERRFQEEIESMIEPGLLVRYNVPTKSGSKIVHRRHLAVNWTNMRNVNLQKRDSALHALLDAAPQKAKKKVRETIAFVEDMKKQGLASVTHKTARLVTVPDDIALTSTEEDMQTNGINPIEILVFEDGPGSALQIIDCLADHDVGAVLVRSNDEAVTALEKYGTIRLYVSDHNFPHSGFVQISGVLLERDILKKRFKGIKSTLLTDNPDAQSPDEGLAFGFRQAGGDYVTDCRGKTNSDIADELVELLELA